MTKSSPVVLVVRRSIWKKAIVVVSIIALFFGIVAILINVLVWQPLPLWVAYRTSDPTLSIEVWLHDEHKIRLVRNSVETVSFNMNGYRIRGHIVAASRAGIVYFVRTGNDNVDELVAINFSGSDSTISRPNLTVMAHEEDLDSSEIHLLDVSPDGKEALLRLNRFTSTVLKDKEAWRDIIIIWSSQTGLLTAVPFLGSTVENRNRGAVKSWDK